jgi:hypothetical protein
MPTLSEITSKVATYLQDNVVQGITAAEMREVLTDLATFTEEQRIRISDGATSSITGNATFYQPPSPGAADFLFQTTR